MKYKLIYHSEVVEDLQGIIDWYNNQQIGLGKRFWDSFKKQEKIIQKKPLLFTIRYKEIRCLKIKPFPYLIHYKVFEKSNTIKVFAVFYGGKNPKNNIRN